MMIKVFKVYEASVKFVSEVKVDSIKELSEVIDALEDDNEGDKVYFDGVDIIIDQN